jgi:hypothetical protein
VLAYHCCRADTPVLVLPQVDQECRDQISNKWVAAPGATANMPISVTAHRGYYPDQTDPIRVPDQNSTRRVAGILALRRVLPKCGVSEALPSAACIPKYFKVVAIFAELNSLAM